MLKIELKRSVLNIGFMIALMMGIFCVVYNKYLIFDRIYESKELAKEWGLKPYEEFSKLTFYSYWVVCLFETGTLYLIYFLGIIASLPYGVSFYRDKKNGFIKNICIRTDKKKYLKSKYIATFISGGMVTAIPIVIDFFLAKLCVPVDFLRLEGTILAASTDWQVFLIDHLYMAAIVYMIIWFIFGGALATISLMVSSYSDNFFTIQLMPFLIMLVAYYLPNLMGSCVNDFMPLHFLTNLGYGSPLHALAVSAVCVLITYYTFMKREMKKDVL